MINALPDSSASLPNDAALRPTAAPAAANQVVIIDAHVADAAALAAAAPAGSKVFILDGASNGVEQIGAILKSVGDVGSLHIVSHGGDGYFLLGSDVVTADTASHDAAALQSWAADLAPGADLLFYGCDLAATAAGQGLVNQIGVWTGADVAASSNVTGASGDWVLEYHQGAIETAALAPRAYREDLGTYLVTTLDDELPSGGSLADDQASGTGLSLREALAAAVGNDHADTIIFSPALFADGQMHTITLRHGELLICGNDDSDDLNIVGVGSSLLNISGDHITRVFSGYSAGDITSTATISGMTISDGYMGPGFKGGAIWVSDAGNLTLDHVVVKDSYSGGGGGGVYFGTGSGTGRLTITHSTISDNISASDGGGVLANAWSATTISSSTFSGNKADFFGGGIHVGGDSDATFTMTNSTIDGNTAAAGGGIFIDSGYGATLINNTITDNVQQTGTAQYGTAQYYSGGGINARNVHGTGLVMQNNFLSGNVVNNTNPTAAQGSDLFLEKTTATGTYNIISGVALHYDDGASHNDGIDNLDGDTTITTAPAIGPLAENGGAVRTRAIDSNSSAAGAGGTGAGVPTTDARGYDRGSHIDIGAYEVNDIGMFHFTGDLFPPAGYTHVPLNLSFTLDFGQPVTAYDGGIEIFGPYNMLFESFSADSPQVSIASDGVVTLNPIQDLVPGASYYIIIGYGAFISANGSFFSGINDSGVWSFTADPDAVAQGPTTTISNLSLMHDSGISDTDFVTSFVNQTVKATLSAALGVGEVLYGSVDDGGDWIDITGMVNGTDVAWYDAVLNDSGTIKLKISNAGADGAIISHAYELDVMAPDQPELFLDHASDLGVSNSDNLTSLTEVTLAGTAEDGVTVTLYDTDISIPIGSAVATGGLWSITTPTLSHGTHLFSAQATDVAGNLSPMSIPGAVEIDTLAPTVTIQSDAPRLLNGETASILFTFSEDPGTTFTSASVHVSGGTLGAIAGAGTMRVATFTPTADTDNGVASITVDEASYTDAAGNAGAAGTTPSLAFDTSVPAAPSTPDLDPDSDLGFSDSDNLTCLTTPTFTGTAQDGAVIKLYDSDGVTFIGGSMVIDGKWSITSDPLSEGVHTVYVQATEYDEGTNTLGNTSAMSAGLTVNIEITSPTVMITSDVSHLKTGETATITFTFDEDPGTTVSDAHIDVSGGTLGALSGDGLTRTATFTPTPGTDYGNASIAMVPGGYSDAAGNEGGAGDTPYLTFDTQGPTVTSVDPLIDSVYLTGQTMEFALHFSEVVMVSTGGGTPRLAIMLDTGTVYADYDSGSGGDMLLFTYTVLGGDHDADGVTLGAVIDLNGGTIKDFADNDAIPDLNSVASLADVRVGAEGPQVSSITLIDPPSNNLGTVYYTVQFSRAVTGVDASDFVLTGDGVTGDIVSAVEITGSHDSYTVAVENVLGTGTLRLDLKNGGTGIVDANSTPITSGYTAGDAYTIDRTAPAVVSVTTPMDGTYKTGAPLEFTVDFGEDVMVDITNGTPTIAVTLDTGGTVQAQYVSGSGGSALTFRYVAVSGDLDTDGVALGAAIALNSGSIRDAAGNDAVLTLNSVGALGGVRVDAVAPTVASIVRAGTAHTNATSVDYTVTFSEDVSGVDTGDFTLNKSGGADGAITGISHVGNTYTVSVTGVTGDGTLRLDLGSSGTGITDTAGNAIAGGFTSGQLYTFDHTGPTVGSVGVPANGTFSTGQPLDFTVNFNEAVTVTTGGGTPRIAVTLDGPTTVYAEYVSGSGGTALVFRYIVANGDVDGDGVTLNSAIELHGGTLKDAAGNDATPTLNGVGALTGVIVNGVSPEVSSIALVDAASNNLSTVHYTVTFSSAVTGVDASDFVLSGSGVTGNIASVTGNVAGDTYTVTVDNVLGDGTLGLELKSGGTGIIDGASNAIASGYAAGPTYAIDHTGPAVSSVAAPANGSYKAGAALTFTVNFGENVTVDTTNGMPTIDVTLDTGGTVQAQYTGGTGTGALTFGYTVAGGDMDANGVALAGAIALNGATMRDALGNDAAPALNAVGALTGVLVDTEAPELYRITTADPTYTNSGTVHYNVKFTESVTGVGVGDFNLFKNHSAAGTIASISGSGDSYVVTVDNVAGDGELRLDLNGSGTGIADLAGNPIPNVARNGYQSYTIDNTGPVINGLEAPAPITHHGGGELEFIAVYNEAVTVTTTGGTPRIALTLDGPNTVYAEYVSGTGSTQLVFRYIVANGDVDSDGVTVGSVIDLNGGTMKDVLGNDANPTLNHIADMSNVLVSALPPEVASITLLDATANNGTSVRYAVTFTTAVTGVDASDFVLSGGVTGDIASVSGSDDSYTVTVDNVAGNGTLRLDLKNSDTGIADNNSYLIASGYTAGDAYTIDQTAPTVGSVAAPASNSYKAGDTLEFTVDFGEDVTVDITNGIPTIAVTLDTNGAGGTVQAQYASGSGGSALTFRYVVASGDLDTDGVALGDAIALNSGTIRDAAGNDAVLTLNSVGALGGVLVDTVAPTVASIVRAGTAHTNATSVDYTVTFSEGVSGVDTGDFSLNKSGGADGAITGISHVGNTYTVSVTGVTGDGTLRLDLDSSGTGITDTAGNAIAGGFTAGQLYTFDHTGPTVGSVGVPANGTFSTGQPLDFTVNFNEAVTVTTGGGTPRIAVTLDGPTTVYAEYVSGSGGTALVFRYIVANGDVDGDGVTINSAIDLHGGTLKDAVGNDATLTLNGVGALTGVIVNGVSPEVSSIALVDAASNNLSTVHYTVTFSSAVTGVDASDFVLSGSGVTGNIASVTGNGAGDTYTVTVDTVAGNGTLRLDLKNSGTGIIDGASNAIASGYTAGPTYVIDHTGPAVSSVAAPANGSYKAGAALTFTVNFGENVTVDTTNGTPTIDVTLDTGGTVQAHYTGGTGTGALTFSYTVSGGDMDANGVALAGAIALNGATMQDALGNDAALALNAVGALTGVLVDTEAPDLYQITRVDPRDNNGGTVHYNVKFTESVTGVGIGDFTLHKGGSAAGTIASISGSGDTYVITIDNVAGDGELRLDMNGSGTGIVDLAGNPIPNVARNGNQSYMLDHTAPAVATVGVPAATTHGGGAHLDFTVNFSEAVTVATGGGTPRIALTLDGPTTVYAEYVSGGGTSALLFRYIVANGDADGDGVTLNSAIDLHGGTLKDAAGNDATPTLNGVGALTGVLVNTAAPEVSSITLVDAATNNLTTVHYTVVFSGAVTGVDIADFVLNGGATGNIASVTGNGAGDIYTVTVDNVAGNGTLRLDLRNSGTGIADASSNAIASGYTAGAFYTIDHAAPTVGSVAAPTNHTYKTGEALDFTVNFGEHVTVDATHGTPTIAVTLGTGGTVQAQYVSGSGTGALVFRHLVVSGELDANGVELGGTITLNSGTIKDAAGNDAVLALNSVGALTGVLVDAVAPTVTTINRAGPETTGATSVDYTVTFAENVTGVDASDFTPTGGAGGTIASVTQISGASYTVGVTGVTGDGTLRLDLNNSGTGIADTAGNAIVGGHTGDQAYTFDHTAPAVGTVGVPTNATYATGQALDFTVNFSEAVTVAGGGTPRIAVTLDTGGTVYAEYVSGGGTSALTFRHIVANGNLDNNGVALGAAIDLNGGTLKDGVGNDAMLALNGVGALTGVLVNGVSPQVSSITAADAATNNHTTVHYTVVFSSAVTGVDITDFVLGGTGVTGDIASVSGGGTTYTVTVDNVAGDGTLRLDLNNSGTGIVDLHGNAIAGGYTTGDAYTIDHTAPVTGSVAVPLAGTYKAGDALNFTVNFGEHVTVDTTHGMPSIAVTLDTNGAGGTVQAQYVSGSGTGALTFRYLVASGDIDANGVALGGTIALGGGGIKDAAGNDATLALNNIGALGGVLVDGQSPAVTAINRVGTETTNAASVDYTVTFSEDVTGVDAGDFTLDMTGTAAGTIASVTPVSGGGYTVSVTGVTGDGTLRLNLNDSGTGITDTDGNPIAAGHTGDQTYKLDHTAPTVGTVGAPASATYVAGQALDFIVNFSEAVNVTTGGGTPRIAVTLDTGGTVYAEYVSGGGTGALTFRHIVANGDVDNNGVALGAAIDLHGGTLKDGAGNDATPALNGVGTLTGVLVNGAGPTVNSIALVDAAANNLTTVHYTVVFSSAVTGVDATDFALGATGTASGHIASVSGDGGTYTVTVDSVAGDGTLRLDLNASGTGIQNTDGGAILTGYTAGASYTLDHTAPAAPAAIRLAAASDSGASNSDGITAVTTPTIQGQGVAGGTVTLRDSNGGTVLGTGVVDGYGNWSIPVSSALSSGVHSITATQADAVGNVSATSDAMQVNIVTSVATPSAPALAPASDSGAQGDRLTNVTTPVVRGVAQAGAQVTLYDTNGSTVLGSTTADASGAWSITSSTLASGSHALTVRQVDVAGNASAASAALALTVDTSVPPMPGAMSLTAATDTGTRGDGITGSAAPQLTGTGTAGATLVVYDRGVAVGSTVVGATGRWTIGGANLAEGGHSLTAVQSNAAGTSSASGAAFALTIDRTAASAITLSNASVPVNAAANTVVGTLANNDAGGTAQTYALVAGTGDGANGAFTIEGGKLRLTDPAHTAAGNYSVRVQVIDAAGNSDQQALTIAVTAVVSTVDGAPVHTSPVTLPGGGGGTAVVVPVVEPGRAETDGATATADIPLATSAAGDTLVAHIPAGVGLSSTGGDSAPAGSSLDALIAAIVARTPASTAGDQAHLTYSGEQFLSLLPATQPLLLNTVVLTGANGAGDNGTLVLTGTANSALQTALVIDATATTGSGQIQLENVAFAAVIGQATVSGTTNGQTLTGDASAQHFVVGGVVGTVVQSGGGDDVLELTAAPSAPSTPSARAVQGAAGELVTPSALLLNGGGGTDTVTLGRDQADYAVTRSDGHLVVTDKVSGVVATLVNVEAIKFADSTLHLDSRAELGVIAALYQNALDRQADVSGFEFWGNGQSVHGASLGEITLDILGSAESIARGNVVRGDAAHDVALLYQALFGRAADAGGAAFWVDAMRHGVTLTQVADGMLASAEMSAHTVAATAWDFHF